jgi:cysteine desulfurase
MTQTIYLDHNATTPIDPRVVEAMADCFARVHANPASQHRPGQQARRVLEDARERIAEILGADLSGPQADRLVLTGTATEANNLAILGIAEAAVGPVPRGDGPPPQIIISSVEHASVIEPAEHLLERGWRLDTLPVSPDGVVRAELLPGWLGPATRLASVILGNHETGVLQPVAALAEACNRAGVPLHTDAAQVVGKLPVDFRRLGAAAMSFGAHKFHGPPGIGGLLLRHDAAVAPRSFGGPHQGGLRPGTEAVALAVGMRAALEFWLDEHDERARRIEALRDRFERQLKAGLPGVVIHGEKAPRLPNTTSAAFPGIEGQVLLVALDLAGVACSVGSACSSGSTELSPTLLALGQSPETAASSLRFSLGATTTEEEIDEAVRRILHVCRELAP